MAKKKTPKPELAVIDCDYLIVSAASSTFNPIYSYFDDRGELVTSFDSAEKGKAWLRDMEELLDIDPSIYTREVTHEIGDPEDAKKRFDKMLAQWVKMSGCK